MTAPRAIFVGTPALDGRVHIGYADSLLRSQHELQRAGFDLTVQFIAQDSLVMQARNSIVAAFRASNATDLVFIDSDIAWKPFDLLKLCTYDLPLVAGAYRRKEARTGFTVRFIDNDAIHRDRKTGLIEVSQVGAGFLRIRRDGIERMIAAYPELGYRPQASDPLRYALFDTSLNNKAFAGEDFTFCARWRAIGGTVWVDPDIELRHIGIAEYTGNLSDFLSRNISKS